MQAAVRSYQQGIRDLVSSGRYDTRDDFTVVAQPFFEDTAIPRLVNSTSSLKRHEILITKEKASLLGQEIFTDDFSRLLKFKRQDSCFNYNFNRPNNIIMPLRS